MLNDCGYKNLFSRNLIVFLFFVTLFVFLIAAFAVYNGVIAYLKARKGVKN